MIWTPTMNLKWTVIEIGYGDYARYEKILQQQWISDTGTFEWRDIEIENKV